jgi:hypothetical protein
MERRNGRGAHQQAQGEEGGKQGRKQVTRQAWRPGNFRECSCKRQLVAADGLKCGSKCFPPETAVCLRPVSDPRKFVAVHSITQGYSAAQSAILRASIPWPHLQARSALPCARIRIARVCFTTSWNPVSPSNAAYTHFLRTRSLASFALTRWPPGLRWRPPCLSWSHASKLPQPPTRTGWRLSVRGSVACGAGLWRRAAAQVWWTRIPSVWSRSFRNPHGVRVPIGVEKGGRWVGRPGVGDEEGVGACSKICSISSRWA